MTKKKIIIICLVILITCLIAGGVVFGFNKYQENQKKKEEQERINNTITSTITMDINPSLEINLNINKIVVSVNALNEDSIKIVDNKNYKGKTLDNTMTSIITSLKENNFLNEDKNTILVNVKSLDNSLSYTVKNNIESITTKEEINIEVIVQSIEETEELKELAEKYNITTSKAYYINEQIKDEEGLTFEDLKDTSINDVKEKVEEYKEEQEKIKKEEEEKKNSSSSSQSRSGSSGSLNVCKNITYNLQNAEAKKMSLDLVSVSANSDARSFAQTTLHNYNGRCAYETIFYYNKNQYYIYYDVITRELLNQTSTPYAITDFDSIIELIKNEFNRRFGANKDDVYVQGANNLLTYYVANSEATVKYNDKWYTVIVTKKSGNIVSITEGSKYH